MQAGPRSFQRYCVCVFVWELAKVLHEGHAYKDLHKALLPPVWAHWELHFSSSPTPNTHTYEPTSGTHPHNHHNGNREFCLSLCCVCEVYEDGQAHSCSVSHPQRVCIMRVHDYSNVSPAGGMCSGARVRLRPCLLWLALSVLAFLSQLLPQLTHVHFWQVLLDGGCRCVLTVHTLLHIDSRR